MFNAPTIQEVHDALPSWTIHDQLGRGTFKVAYRAEWHGRTEALKLFYVPRFGSEEDSLLLKDKFMARFARELRLLEKCVCPHLVKLGSLPPTPVQIARMDFVAYSEELLEGSALSELIASGNLPSARDVALLIKHLVAAVSELWNDHKCVHRDIKPDNIRFIQSKGRGFVLLDLGITFDAEGTRLTDASISPGTPTYRAPEMLQAEYWNNLNEKTDLYCIGVTAFEYAAGVHPILGTGSKASLTARILNEPPLKILQVRPDFDGLLGSIIDRLNRKSAALRGGLPLIQKELESLI